MTSPPFSAPEAEMAALRADNARLRRLLDLTAEQARPPAAAQTGLFLDSPGPVTASSSGPDKVRFFRTLFAARTDVYAIRWDNARTGRSGWSPAVEGGWRKGTNRPYLRLTDRVVEAHLKGEVHLGLYPLLIGDTCHWLAADFDGPAATLDALAYLKAARAVGVPAALEVSQSGIGSHVWIFFTGPVPAATARALGSGLLREAIALRGRMSLILGNPRYTGRQVWDRQRTERDGDDTSHRSTLAREWAVSATAAHPALVTEAQFVAAQQMRAARPTGDGEKRRYLLSGLVRCALCGRRLDSTWVHGRAAYRCRHGHIGVRPPVPDRWKIVYVREDVLVRELLDRHPLGHEVADDWAASAMVTKLHKAGTLIRHDGINWNLTHA